MCSPLLYWNLVSSATLFLCLSQITNPSFIDLFLLLIIIKLLEFPFPSLNIDWVDSKLPPSTTTRILRRPSFFKNNCVHIYFLVRCYLHHTKTTRRSLPLSRSLFHVLLPCGSVRSFFLFLCRDMRAYPIRVGEGKKKA